MCIARHKAGLASAWATTEMETRRAKQRMVAYTKEGVTEHVLVNAVIPRTRLHGETLDPTPACEVNWVLVIKVKGLQGAGGLGIKHIHLKGMWARGAICATHTS